MSYVTMTGRVIPTDGLGWDGQAALDDLLARRAACPPWAEYQSFARERIRGIVPPGDVRHPLYLIAQDLHLGLGVAQGKVAPPDWRDSVADMISERYGSRPKFCQATDTDPEALQQILHGKNPDMTLAATVVRILGLDPKSLPGWPQ